MDDVAQPERSSLFRIAMADDLVNEDYSFISQTFVGKHLVYFVMFLLAQLWNILG